MPINSKATFKWLNRVIGLLGWLSLILAWVICFAALSRAQEIPVKTVTWNHRVYKVETVAIILGPQCNSTTCYGMTYCRQGEIDIRYSVPKEAGEQRVIMFHELQHVVEDCSDKETTQHDAIYDVSEPMMELLRDKRNKQLKDWLFNAAE